MAGLKTPIGGPVPSLSPELLAQLAQAAFRPPPLTGMPGLPSMPAAPGFNVDLRDAAKMLGEGLAKWQPTPIPTPTPGLEPGRTANDGDLNGYNGRPALVDVGNGVMLPNPNADFLSGAPPGISPDLWARIIGSRTR